MSNRHRNEPPTTTRAPGADARTETPQVSIVIPVYNEAGMIVSALTELRAALETFPYTYEIIVAENGSRDDTVALATDMAAELDDLEVFSLGEPNYGKALKQGILRARGEYVICDEIDICDVNFYRRAMDLLSTGKADMVVGSKVMKGASDDRPMLRHAATLILNGMLRAATGFKGTDTHGLKAFRREALLGTVNRCVIDRDLFASELVVRANRENVAVTEIPLRIAEKRKPSINLFKRVPNVLKNMARLTYVIRFRAPGRQNRG